MVPPRLLLFTLGAIEGLGQSTLSSLQFPVVGMETLAVPSSQS